MTEENLGSPATMDEKKPLLDFIPPPSPTKPQTVDIKLEDTLFSASSPPPARIASSSRSRSPSRSRSRSPSAALSASKGRNGAKKEKSPPAGPILIPNLPVAWDEAHETFETLEKCVYERKDLGLSRESDEMMVCDCAFDKHDPTAEGCTEHSDCINRALFIECLAGECRAKSQCRNQRFNRRQYAPIEIVLTELKGFGLRAADDIPSGSLIYEYIGEVVQERTFRKRMAQYADEGIRHFYFMMLQKEEYIDATKKGGIGRFANHSCNPNSEVQKWVVGRRLRMGIFTKRDVVKGEEITFNYNVDRYGHDAQICYCGEPNCVGFIGGKTQTDSSIGTMNDLFIDALGIADEVEALQLKGNKKKKSKQLDEDFVPTLRPISDSEVQKVAAAVRQSSENGKMMARLLERINMTEEPVVQRQLMRMHGFGLMNMVLTQLSHERQVVLLALESLAKWKLQVRNKVEDSGIEEPVKKIAESDDEELRSIAKGLLEYWSTLEISYKIPRKPKIKSLDEDDEAATTTIAEADQLPRIAQPRRPQTWENDISIELDIAPVKPRVPVFSRPRPPPPPLPPRQPSSQFNPASADRLKLDAIIAMAQQNVAAAATASESPAAESSRSGSRAVEAEDEDRDRRKRQRRESRPEDQERKKEKELKLLVGGEVVRAMTKYREFMDHDTFKRYAQECTELLVEKEKKGHSYAAHRHPTLNDDKRAKVKAFTKEFVHKVLKKLKEKGKLRKGSHASGSGSSKSRDHASKSASTPSATPNTVSDNSTVLQTPDGHNDLVNDIFDVGDDDDDDGSQSVHGQATPAKDMDVDMDDRSATALSVPPPGSSPVNQTPLKRDRPDSVAKVNGGHAVIKVDSFRPGSVTTAYPKATPSRTPTSDGER